MDSSQRKNVESEFVDPLEEATQIESVCLERSTAVPRKERGGSELSFIREPRPLTREDRCRRKQCCRWHGVFLLDVGRTPLNATRRWPARRSRTGPINRRLEMFSSGTPVTLWGRVRCGRLPTVPHATIRRSGRLTPQPTVGRRQAGDLSEVAMRRWPVNALWSGLDRSASIDASEHVLSEPQPRDEQRPSELALPDDGDELGEGEGSSYPVFSPGPRAASSSRTRAQPGQRTRQA